MDIPKYAVKGLGLVIWRGLGGREVYRGLRVLHWMDTDRRDPKPANIAERNQVRDRIREKWGGWWTGKLGGLPSVPPPRVLTMEQRMEQRWNDNDMKLMTKLSPEELRGYHEISFRKSFLQQFGDKMQQILDAGPNSRFAHWYKGLASPDAAARETVMGYIQEIYIDVEYRTWRYEQFQEKIEYEKKVVKKVEKANLQTLMVDQWYKMLHGLNDDTLEKIFEQLLKLLTLAS